MKTKEKIKTLLFFVILAVLAATCEVATSQSVKTDTVKVVVDTIKVVPTTIDTISVLSNKWAELKENILGDKLTGIGYISAFFFSFLGLFLRWVFTANKATKKYDNGTPNEFSWSYWFKDNLSPKLLSLLTNIIVIFLCLRFSVEWFGMIPSMIFAVTVGLCFDWFADFIKKIQPNYKKTE